MGTNNKASNNLIKIIYIAACSKSGSTLLDLMLDSHSKIFSIGEGGKALREYANLNRHNIACTCGAEDIYKCPVWSAIDKDFIINMGIALKDIDTQTETNDFYIWNYNLFRSISRSTGKIHIVDSSKNIERLEKLTKMTEIELYPIHLIRGPKAQVYSMYRTGHNYKKMTRDYTYRHKKMNKVLKGEKHIVVYYENLVKNTQKELSRIMDFLGIELEANQFKWANQKHHNLGGNRMRFKMQKINKNSEIRMDNTWKKGFNFQQKLYIDFYTFPAKFQNYVCYLKLKAWY